MKTILSWSTGKDSAWALHTLRSAPGVELVGLLTTIDEASQRVAMHGIRRSLIEAQAQAARLPLHVVQIPWPCPNEVYEARISSFIAEARKAGVEAIAFGDLFLADIRAYREARLSGTGITPLFPLWGRDTAELADEMIAAGLRAQVTCLDPRSMPHELAGRTFDKSFLANLPETADPCGENGEFHTFAYAGPMFDRPIAFEVGETTERDGFLITDLK